ncbi:uncharacterized protein LOC126790935 [Argentina anserina]|uniref:uncharacterized protein LOC126790935 n=1 Tax=Argentina anserina TaxID=57926 RepID=UPI002176682C|nr:uncharacterized protein LOC126790935 [Potentilla anserina]
MALYEPIKVHEVDEEDGMADSVIIKNVNQDVEMAVPISKLTSSAPPNDAVSFATAYSHSEGTTLPTCSKVLHRQQQRLVSLDVFRGLTVALMILVDEAGGLLPPINHAPWNGLTLADLVMPFFLFMVGVSLSLVYKRLSCRAIATKKALLRGFKLLALGMFLQGGFFHGIKELIFGVDIAKMRWMGILQRIGIGYLVAALCEIWLKGDGTVISGSSLLRKYKLQLVMAVMISVTYLLLLYGLYVPDWEYQVSTGPSSAPKIFSVKCGVRGDTGPACNAVAMIDRNLLGLQHLYRRPIY